MYFFLEKPSANISIINIIHYIKEEKKNFKFSTGLKIDPSNWDSENRLPKTLRGTPGIKNKNLSAILLNYSKLLESEIQKAKEQNYKLTKEVLKEAFVTTFKNPKKNYNFIEVVQLFIDSKNNSGAQSKSWNQKYSNLKAKLELFQASNKRPILFEDIDEDWIDSYCGFLRVINCRPLNAKKTDKKFTPHNDNTLHRNINFLYTFLIWAKGKHHEMDIVKNPVKKYQSEAVYLTSAEIKLLEEIELDDRLDKIRDMFLIGVYSGQRFSDYSVFEKADVKGDMIIKKAEKTEEESYIPLHSRLVKLLDKYDWKLPEITSQRFNPYIQTICKLAGIEDEFKETKYNGNEKNVVYWKKWEKVSSHTARRTFITLSAEKGMPDFHIMKVTGIRDIKTLEKYKKTSQRSIVESMNKYWG